MGSSIPQSNRATGATKAFRWWCVVLLKRHSSIVRRPGRTCKHVRSPNPLPAISDEVKGSQAIAR